MKEKDNLSKLDESDLKYVKELGKLLEKLNKPFWKFVIGIIMVSSLMNVCYYIGYFIGLLLGK